MTFTSFSLEGQTLGKYRVLEPLGRGGMARVYRAYHPQLDRYVAIKVLRSDLVEDQEFQARFRHEAQAVAALRHTNIVQVYDFDVQGDVYYMVMELLEGDTLKARLLDYRARGEQMPLGEIVRLLHDVLGGLAYAHGEGMIHRDIKPANVMLTRRGQAVIADFGLAQIVGSTRHTATGALMGTLNYMAPEQGFEGRSDERSDLYSLGIMLYKLLTQRVPYDADTPLAILMKHLNDPLPLPRQVDPTIPEPFERIVLKAVAKNPEDRYQNAGEMAKALQKAAQEAGVALPARLSPPLSFTTPEAPSESVAVLSGSARERIQDVEFAHEDTDARLGQRLEAERMASRLVASSCGQIALAFLGVVGFMAVVHMVAGPILTLLDAWELFTDRLWPVELLAICLGLCVVMYVTRAIWVLVPTTFFLGNGVLFAFYSLTDNWNLWTILWPLEPALIVGAVVLPIWLARRGVESRLSRPLAWAMGLTAMAASISVVVLAIVL